MTRNVAYFFSGCKDPIAVSNVVTHMATGMVMQVNKLPTEILPAVVLLATIGLRGFEQQIVDDYVLLFDRMTECFKDSTVWNDKYDHPNLSIVSGLINDGPRGEFWLDTHPECDYMFAVYEELVGADPDQLFKPVKEKRRA